MELVLAPRPGGDTASPAEDEPVRAGSKVALRWRGSSCCCACAPHVHRRQAHNALQQALGAHAVWCRVSSLLLRMRRAASRSQGYAAQRYSMFGVRQHKLTVLCP